MNTSRFRAAAVVAVLCAHSTMAAEETPSGVETNQSIRPPSVEINVGYSSMKIERGAIENPESVLFYGAELEWYGFIGEFEACHDLTDINNRRGRYNEIAALLGYRYTLGDFTASAGYVYKDCLIEGFETQEIHFEFEYETPWVTPFLDLEFDTYNKPGSLYGVFGLEREWQFCDWLGLTTYGGIGFGNAYRNDTDFELSRNALREMVLGARLEFELCPHLKFVPSLAFLDYFTDAQRSCYDKFNGFACVVACAVVLEF